MAHAMAGQASRCMLRQGDLVDACYGKANYLEHIAARRPGRFCSEWASNVVFDERVTIPYVSDGVMTWCFL